MKKLEELDLSPMALHLRIENVEQHTSAMMAWKKSIEESTRVQLEMVEVGKSIAGALEVLGWVGNAIKWVAGIGATCYACYAAVKGVNHL